MSTTDPQPEIPVTPPPQEGPVQLSEPLGSVIISELPGIFPDFHGKLASLLWRGSRDGFKASDFHRRCDGHKNTMILILDTKGNIFGGFTPVEWESLEWNGRSLEDINTRKADATLKSFLFTLANPHKLPARRFPLKRETNDQAIDCSSKWGPHFRDFGVSDNCNKNRNSWSALGLSYTNDTGVTSRAVLTGASRFQVKDIEVFAFSDVAPVVVPPRVDEPLDSQIISEIPEILPGLKGNRASILWRGSRDGFDAREFHRRCDGHANTLAVVLDTNGNIFGGFTPTPWASGEWYWKGDASLKSYVFTLTNPRGFPARRFEVKAGLDYLAIDCDPERGPSFGFNDLFVSGRGGGSESFGSTYLNDSGLDGATLFTGAPTFDVREIEVFEVPNFDPLAPPPVVQLSERLDSHIVADLPGIFADFHQKWPSLLYRGGSHGFDAASFHRCCDFYPNTLALVLDTDGNVFGGYTPVPWQSVFEHRDGGSSEGLERDASVTSFLFTLKNPHRIPARRFPLAYKKRGGAISFGREKCLSFGHHELWVATRGNTNTNSTTERFGDAYLNDTGLDGKTVFTGAQAFRVSEVEVFQLLDCDPHAQPPPGAPARSPDSAIVSRAEAVFADFPDVFAEFQGRSFRILWRGSRDGFAGREFHRRCDGRANTLVVVLDTKGNIFGGFTPVEWESRTVTSDLGTALQAVKGDDSGKSFLFTLVNPHKIGARRFPLASAHQAIFCDGKCGPCFSGTDLIIVNHCNVVSKNWSMLGNAYTNNTNVADADVLTGSREFRVKEIEVFQIED